LVRRFAGGGKRWRIWVASQFEFASASVWGGRKEDVMRGPTTDHEEIRRWAANHHAVPVEVAIQSYDGRPARLRFTYGKPSAAQNDLRPISWDSFFAVFDLLGLALVYNDTPRYELLQIEHKSTRRFEGKIF
jgi:hypothetical protein